MNNDSRYCHGSVVVDHGETMVHRLSKYDLVKSIVILGKNRGRRRKQEETEMENLSYEYQMVSKVVSPERLIMMRG